MKENPVLSSTFIIRSQVEYSTVAQMVVHRYILEKPATGQRCGFTDLEALLVLVRAELVDLQEQIISLNQENKNL